MCPFIFCPPCVQNNTIPWITTSGLKMLYRRGLIDMDDSSSWLWFMIVVATVLMTALVVKSRSRNWKISIWFFVLGVTQNRIRSGEERVVPSPMWTKRITEHDWDWSEPLNIIKHVTRESGDQRQRFYLDLTVLRFWSWLSRPPTHFQSQEKSRMVPFQASLKHLKDAVWFDCKLATNRYHTLHVTNAKVLQHIIQW